MVDAGGILGIIFGSISFLILIVYGLYTGIPSVKTLVDELLNPKVKSDFSTGFLATFTTILTYFIFLAGPITDVVSQQYRYSIASIVGFCGSIIVLVLNQPWFSNFSHYFIGEPWATTGDPTTLTVLYSFLTRFLTAGMILLVSALIIVPSVFAGLKDSKSAAISSSVIGTFIGVVILGGFDFLSKEGVSVSKNEARLRELSAEERSKFDEIGNTTGSDEDKFNSVLNDVLKLGSKEGWSSSLDLNPKVKESMCDVPGTGKFFSNTLAPPSIILTQTIIWCHLIEQWDIQTGKAGNFGIGTSQGSNGSVGLIVTSVVTFILQWITLYSSDCLADTKYIYGKWAPLVSLMLSIVFAGTAYGTLKATSESFTDKKDVVREHMVFSNTPPPSIEKDPSKIKVGEPILQNLPVNDNDEFVCEAYKDGELISSSLVT
jgi:hypothetical protein